MATMASEAIPVATAKRLNCNSTARPIKACATRKTSACGTLTCPAGIGRDFVRSTLASRSRSVMSFQVQPAPRMAKAPRKNNAMTSGSRLRLCVSPAASAVDHQHGNSSSQDPIGRSRRASRKYGRDHAGARVSTQLPVASATRAAASFIWVRRPLLEIRSDRRSSRQHVAVQRVEGAAAALFRGRSLRESRRRTQNVAQAGARGSLLLHLLGDGTDLLLHPIGVLVSSLELFQYLRWNPATRRVGFDVFDHLDFDLGEVFDQLAGLSRGRMPIARGLDHLAALLRLFAQREESLHAIVAGTRLGRRSGHGWVSKRRPTDPRKRAGRRRGAKGRRGRCAVHRRKCRIIGGTHLARQWRRKRTLRQDLAGKERNDGHGKWRDQAADHQSYSLRQRSNGPWRLPDRRATPVSHFTIAPRP